MNRILRILSWPFRRLSELWKEKIYQRFIKGLRESQLYYLYKTPRIENFRVYLQFTAPIYGEGCPCTSGGKILQDAMKSRGVTFKDIEEWEGLYTKEIQRIRETLKE